MTTSNHLPNQLLMLSLGFKAGKSDIAPHVGILDPLDNGSAWYDSNTPVIAAYAVYRGGRII